MKFIYIYMYRIAGYFNGALIFAIFMVHQGVKKTSTLEIFGMCSTVYMCSKSDRQHFVMALFHYSGTKDSVLDPQNPRSQAVKHVMAERGV